MSVIARFSERARPWSASTPDLSGRPMVAVIGAGPAGLATAALLQRDGAHPIVFDRRDRLGGSWPDRYDSMRLNTVRWMSDLPGYRMPARYGRWVGRDDVVAYLDDYAAHHDLEVRLGVHVDDARRGDDGQWWVTASHQPTRVAGVVVATGHSRVAHVPDWDGLDQFAGRFLHASAYRRPADHRGRRVMVVGAGSSGGEIAVDLARAGVVVDWSVRTAPQVLPRQVVGLPATPLAPIGDSLPDPWLDRLAPAVERRIYGTRDYLPEPSEPMMQLLERCKEPMTADGIVELIREGAVRVVAAVDHLAGDGVVLSDGSRLDPDDVIAATGYRPALGGLFPDETLRSNVLDRDGRPRSLVPVPGLGFVGFRIPLTGTLWAIETDARRVAATLLP